MTAPVMAADLAPLAAKLPIPTLWDALLTDGCTLPSNSYAGEIRAHALAEHPDAIVAATGAELDRRRDVMRGLVVRAETAEGRMRAFTDAAHAVLDAVTAQGALV